MGEVLVLSRNRFIRRLLEQNFIRVDGPRLEDGNVIYYEVWRQCGDPEDACSVRIAFDRKFLSKPANEFARTTIRVVREAKGMLNAGGGTVVGPEVWTEFHGEGNVRTGWDTA